MTVIKPALAKHPFWLDGGYDRDAVEACPFHPFHHWWVFQLGDVVVPEGIRDPEEWMVICSGCYVPRCGHVEHETNPCLLPRHHREDHWTAVWKDANTR
jgi:hypothetical protein